MARYIVAGAGVAGEACALALLANGATVTVVDRTDGVRLAALRDAGAEVVVADDLPAEAFAQIEALVVSPGIPPHHPLVATAAKLEVEIYSEPELAWRLRPADAAPWLAITGTNGKTTTTTMLAAILTAAGHRTAALGNIGLPLIDAARDPAFDVLAVELSSFQLHWSQRLAPRAGALLNLADDHLDWHGSRAAYEEAKLHIWRGETPIGNLDDVGVAEHLPDRGVGFTLGQPAAGQLGVTDGVLVDRAFADEPVELGPTEVIRPVGEHNVSNALAAAALARSFGAPASAVIDGLAGYAPEPHRNQLVAKIDRIKYVDDSKATNPHAALASLTAYPHIVWVAGGQLKGVDIDDLVRTVAARLRGAVLLGVDRAEIAAALRRHAPDLPVVTVDRADDGAMADVVPAAAALAQPGDTVLLAPAAASLDMFPSYAARGRSFAEAVHALTTGGAQ